MSKQATFEGLRMQNPLRFDAILTKPDPHGDTHQLVAVEVDGDQHFRPVQYLGGEDGHARTRESDRLK